MAVDRRTLIGGGLVLAIGFAGWMLFGRAEATSTPQAAAPRPTPRPAGAQPAGPEATVAVRLEALEADRDQPGEAQRNPFRFQPRLAPPTSRGGEPPARPANQTPSVPEAPRGPPAPPAIPLKFIGTLEREDGTRWAVLADARGTFHGREGMVVGGMYQILKIGVESIELAYADGRGRQTIKMTGQ
jgi:hypothetical protein